MTEAPPDLWSESGEMLWIRADLAATGERAKRIAFVGHDPARTIDLPETFLGGEHYGYNFLHVTEQPLMLRPGDGWAGKGETWFVCEPGEPGAVAYWQVTA